TEWYFDPPTVTAPCCPDLQPFILSTETNGTCPQVITRTWQVTDCCSNISTCTQTVTVVDTTPPMIQCASNIVVTACTNTLVPFFVTATDNCCGTNVAVVCTPPSPGPFPVGTTLVHCVATDCCSNTASCD